MSETDEIPVRLELRLSEHYSSLTDVVQAVEAVDTLVGAAVWLVVATPGIHTTDAERAALELMRHRSLGTQRPGPRWPLVRQAVFADPGYKPRDHRHLNYDDDAYAVTSDAMASSWLRRELEYNLPVAYDQLFRWLDVESITRESPFVLTATTALGAAAAAVAMAPPAAIPIAAVSLFSASIDLWRRFSEARATAAAADEARSRARTAAAKADTAGERERLELRRLTAAVERSELEVAELRRKIMRDSIEEMAIASQQSTPGNPAAISLSASVASAAATQLASSPAVVDFQLVGQQS